jgi:fructoselysine 6-kinase
MSAPDPRVPDRHRRPRLLAVGDNVVDRYPQRGLMYPGGNAVNVAVHSRRLGSEAAYIGALGTDAAGKLLLRTLRDEGVDISRTRVVDGPNAYAVIEVVDGNRIFSEGYLGVSVFDLTDADLRAAGGYDVVHTGECSNIEGQLSDLADASRLLSFDFSERDWDYVEEFAPRVSIATWSSPGSDLEEARRRAERLRGLGPAVVAVTLGAQGALALTDTLTHRPAPAGPIVDTLGAGDAFIARFLYGVTRDEPMESVLAAATSYATANCASFGAFGYGAPLATHAPRTTPSPTTEIGFA